MNRLRSLIRPRLLVAAGLLVILGVGATQARAFTTTPTETGAQPETVEAFLTLVTKDVDAYWTDRIFKQNGLDEPRVSPRLESPPARPRPAPVAATPARWATAPRPIARATTRSTSPSSSRPTSPPDRSTTRCRAAPGLRQDVRRLRGRLHRRPRVRPPDPGRARPLRRTAACHVRLRAAGRLLRRHVGQQRLQENSVDEGDVEEAIDAALAVGDFDEGSPGHHGNAEQRAWAFSTGLRLGRPVRLHPLRAGVATACSPRRVP